MNGGPPAPGQGSVGGSRLRRLIDRLTGAEARLRAAAARADRNLLKAHGFRKRAEGRERELERLRARERELERRETEARARLRMLEHELASRPSGAGRSDEQEKHFREAHTWRKRALRRELELDALAQRLEEERLASAWRVPDEDRFRGERARFWEWLAGAAQTGTLLDLGANDGAFGEFIARRLSAREVHAFEPQASCRSRLEERASSDPGFHYHPVALSDAGGEARLYENALSAASSLLPLTQKHRTEFGHSYETAQVPVRAERLDDAVDAEALEREVFVKMDVQGAELKVIRGGERVFRVARAVYVEMSYVALYEGQATFDQVHEALGGLGLRIAGVHNQVLSLLSGEPLFCHCLYLREGQR